MPTDTVKCPYCPVEVPEGDAQAELRHMQECHPEVIDQRREAAGFIQVDGKWVDRYA